MGIEQRTVVLNIKKMCIRFSVFLTIVIYHPCSYASDWIITPSVSLTETYSDNVNLDTSGNEEGAFVTVLSPGVSIRKDGKRNRLNLDYRMQNIHNAGGDENLDISQQFQFNSNSEIVRNSLFLDLDSSLTQQNITNIRASNNNLNGGGNRTDVFNYGISPYWTPHLNGYVDGEVRFTYDELNTDSGAASDAENFEYSVRLDSGRRFSRFTWFVDHNKRVQKNDSGSNVRFQDSLVELRGNINRHYSVFTQIGYSKNNFQSTTNLNNNGLIYLAGARWNINQSFMVEGGLGNNSFVTVDVKPTLHTHWVMTYRNNDVGRNTNSVWQTDFDFVTKRSIWRVSYQEDTTTIQNVLSNIQAFTLTNAFGNPVLNPVTQQPVQSNLSLPTLNNQVTLIKNGEISVAYDTGKSTVLARMFYNEATFQVTRGKNEVYGISGSWDWRFDHRNTVFIRPTWQHTRRTDSILNEISDNRYDVSVGLIRTIPVTIGRRGSLNAVIDYRYVKQTSNDNNNEFNENSITAGLVLTF